MHGVHRPRPRTPACRIDRSTRQTRLSRYEKPERIAAEEAGPSTTHADDGSIEVEEAPQLPRGEADLAPPEPTMASGQEQGGDGDEPPPLESVASMADL